MTIFYAKSLYIGYDLKEFNRIRELLNANGIKYKYKVNNRMGQFSGIGTGTVRSQTGSFGVSPDNMYEYEVKVKESDYSKAKYVIMPNK